MVATMASCIVLLTLYLTVGPCVAHRYTNEEGNCFSRFDYEYKVIKKLVEFEARHATADRLLVEQRLQIDEQKRQLAAASEQQGKLDQTIRTQREEIVALKSGANDVVKSMTELEGRVSHAFSKEGSSTYIRWGRTSCPGNGTEVVYSGYAGGSHYTHSGAASSYLCLPRHPLWGKYNDSQNSYGLVYGAEYQDFGKLITGVKQAMDDVPCAVCISPRTSVLMIPARNECYDGWTLEYHGYLSSGSQSHTAASDYVCLDAEPEVVTGGSANENGKLFYQVEARCGSLKCPPYVNGRELTCSVCTK